jgi:hypothetical protein
LFSSEWLWLEARLLDSAVVKADNGPVASGVPSFPHSVSSSWFLLSRIAVKSGQNWFSTAFNRLVLVLTADCAGLSVEHRTGLKTTPDGVR